MKPLIARLALTAGALLALAGGAQAQALDGGAFVDWERLGDVSQGGVSLRLTTASVSFEDDFPLAAGALNLSGTPAAAAGLAPASVEVFAGIDPGALDADLVMQATEGSAVRRSFQGGADLRLSMQWVLDTRDDALPDLAFVVLDGNLLFLGTALDATLPGGTPQTFTTGMRSFTAPLLQGGLHTLVIGIVDRGDYNQTSTLAVSQLQLLPVPEAPALPAMLAGAALLAGALRRRVGRDPMAHST